MNIDKLYHRWLPESYAISLRNGIHQRQFQPIYRRCFNHTPSPSLVEDFATGILAGLSFIPSLTFYLTGEVACSLKRKIYPLPQVNKLELVISKEEQTVTYREGLLSKIKVVEWQFDGKRAAAVTGRLACACFCQDIEIRLKSDSDEPPKRLWLPVEVKKALTGILNKGTSVGFPPYFCCYDFVYALHGIGYPYSTSMEFLEHWETRPVKGALKSGKCYACVTDDMHARHAALYLGAGLFLSFYGVDGPLVVSTLPQMHEIYLSRQIVELVRPRHKGLTPLLSVMGYDLLVSYNQRETKV